MKGLSKRTTIFFILDFISSGFAWIIFYFLRKKFIENAPLTINNQFYKGVFLIPIFWIFIYTLQGTYIDIKRLYRSRTFNLSLQGSFIGSIILFFLVLIDDKINSYNSYYALFLFLFASNFILNLLVRLIFTSIQVYRIQTLKDYFNTLIIGESTGIIEIYEEVKQLKKSTGNKIIGYIKTDEENLQIDNKIENLNFDELDEIIKRKQIEEVILTKKEFKKYQAQILLAKLSGLGINIKVKGNEKDIFSGKIKQNNIYGLLYREIQIDILPFWQKSLKRFFDIIFSVISLILLIPVFIVISIGVKKSSKGPIFFLQERIGKNGIPFKIIKFRTMYLDAEKSGPQLSSTNDSRITKFGKFLRKTRLDEFPQFINVLKGEMSLVGPRPERKYYIEKISEKEPYFLQLTIVRPGITSWGQVKYGYAENVEQMVKRMSYDLLYIKNRSLALDFKIMFYTIITILKAKGK
jgi:exopolysaccharide biosynthesis polyprenyl glycosylphosphotransferase